MFSVPDMNDCRMKPRVCDPTPRVSRRINNVSWLLLLGSPITSSDLSFLTGQQIRLINSPELSDILRVSIATRVRRAYDGSISLMSRSLKRDTEASYTNVKLGRHIVQLMFISKTSNMRAINQVNNTDLALLTKQHAGRTFCKSGTLTRALHTPGGSLWRMKPEKKK